MAKESYKSSCVLGRYTAGLQTSGLGGGSIGGYSKQYQSIYTISLSTTHGLLEEEGARQDHY